MVWREMTEQELATRPEARLGGALLWMVAAAAALFVVAVVGLLFGLPQFTGLGRYMIAVGFIALWSAVFVVMTLLRARVTPFVTSAGLIGWIVYRFVAALLGHTPWPFAIDSLGEALLAAGFCGYMAGGVRPNAYYRRRLPAP
jgi:hypothetical protein